MNHNIPQFGDRVFHTTPAGTQIEGIVRYASEDKLTDVDGLPLFDPENPDRTTILYSGSAESSWPNAEIIVAAGTSSFRTFEDKILWQVAPDVFQGKDDFVVIRGFPGDAITEFEVLKP